MSMNLVIKAKAVAESSHDGQTYGQHDYFTYHVAPVVFSVIDAIDAGILSANRMRMKSKEIAPTANYIIVAYLHDIVEDTDVTLQYIGEQFGNDIMIAVDAITKRKKEKYDVYIERVRINNVARVVKYYDILNNLQNTIYDIKNDSANKASLKRVDKYMRALHLLG